MYCIVLYINYFHHKRFQNESLSTLKSLGSVDADPLNSRLYFNPNCILQLILDHICTEAHMNIDGDHYDMCTLDGDLLNIKDYNPTISGLSVFKRRQTYAIVMIKKNTSSTLIEELTPMLNPNSEVCETLVKKIREKNPLKRRSSSIKRRSTGSSKFSISRSQGSHTSTTTSKGKRTSSAAI